MDLAKAGTCRIRSDAGMATGFHVIATRRSSRSSRDPRQALALSCMVTASHVLPTTTDMETAVAIFDKMAVRLDPATLLLRDAASDVVVVALARRVRVPSLPLRREVEPGAPCLGLHFPRGVIKLRASRGIVSAQTATGVLHTVPTHPGSSGCPIVDADGRALAVHIASNVIVLPSEEDLMVNEGARIDRVIALFRRAGYDA